MRLLSFITFILLSVTIYAQNSLILKKQRPPELDVSNYKQIAIGDIVGPLGNKNEQSLDLTDALTARLFNANTLEVLDRNALDNLLGSQRFKDLQVIDDQTKQVLNKKLTNAILITGRIQSQQLTQQLIYEDQGVVINGCSRKYYYLVKGDITIQLKVLDVKTGKMIFSNPVIQPIRKQTKTECQIPEKLDIDQITREGIKDLSEQIAKLVVPFEVSTTLKFREPGLFKSPFKKLDQAVSFLKLNNADPGLIILKDYTESKDVKDKVKDEAWFNYGMALLYAGKNSEAKKALQQAATLNAENMDFATELIKIIDDDEVIAKKLEAQALARQRVKPEVTPAPGVKDDKTKKTVVKPKTKG